MTLVVKSGRGAVTTTAAVEAVAEQRWSAEKANGTVRIFDGERKKTIQEMKGNEKHLKKKR